MSWGEDVKGVHILWTQEILTGISVLEHVLSLLVDQGIGHAAGLGTAAPVSAAAADEA